MSYTERTAYFESGAGTPMVLLHGLHGTWPVWEPVIPALSEHHTVFAPTLAGHRGGPAIQSGPHGVAPLADAVEQQMDERGWSHAHLVGNSLGGWVAAELAHRGRASSLVVLSPAGAWESAKDFSKLARKMRLMKRSSRWRTMGKLVERPGARRRVLHAAFKHGDRIPADEARAMLIDTQQCVVLEGLLDWVALNPRLPAFDVEGVPTRVAWADPDLTISWERYGQAFARLLPGAEVVKMSGVGHVPMYDDPNLVARTVLEVSRASRSSRAAR